MQAKNSCVLFDGLFDYVLETVQKCTKEIARSYFFYFALQFLSYERDAVRFKTNVKEYNT